MRKIFAVAASEFLDLHIVLIFKLQFDLLALEAGALDVVNRGVVSLLVHGIVLASSE